MDNRSGNKLLQIGGAIGLIAVSILGEKLIYFIIILFLASLYVFISLRRKDKLTSNIMLLINIITGIFIIQNYANIYLPIYKNYYQILNLTLIILFFLFLYYCSFVEFKKDNKKGALTIFLVTTIFLIVVIISVIYVEFFK